MSVLNMVIKFESFFGITPAYNFKEQIIAKQKYLKIKVCALVILFILLNIILINRQYGGHLHKPRLTYATIVSILSGISCHLIIIHTIFSTYKKMAHWESLLKQLVALENKTCLFIQTNKRKHLMDYPTYLMVFVNLIMCLVFCALNAIIFVSGLQLFPSIFDLILLAEQDILHFSYIPNITFVANITLNTIRVKYNTINDIIRNIKHKEDNVKIIKTLHQIDFVFYGLAEIIKNYKCIFQPTIFLLIVYSFLTSLASCCLIYLFYMELFFRLNLILVVLCMIMAFSCILMCDMTKKEIEKVASTCLKVQLYFLPQSEVCEALNCLSYKMTSMKNEFSAWGFFEIKRSVMVSMFAAVATYFITFIQIKI
nr:gustatory receptor 8 [Pachyrhinus yasumatsui]